MVTGDTLVLVGCGSSKRDGREYSFQLYDSDYFGKKMALAVTVGEPLILSAEHGIVYCDEKLDPYNTHIDDLSAAAKESWAWNVHDELVSRSPDTLVLLIPQSYYDVLEQQFTLVSEECGTRILDPFANTEGIGEQMAWLKEAVPRLRRGTPLDGVLP